MWTVDLSGSVALVTGASRGIGRAVALGLAAAGAAIIGTARSEADLDRLGDEIEAQGGAFASKAADLSDVGVIPSLVDESWRWREGLDILINAAGTLIRSDPPHVQPSEWDDTMAVNLAAPFFLTQETGRRMFDRGRGTIVNIASLAGEVVTGAPLMYQASKAGVIQLTRGFAERFAPFVRVNAVGPGYIRTSLNEQWLDSQDNARYVEERTLLARVGDPEDVVGAVVFLASPAAGFITGQHLRVDGGWSH
jgi:NAD(P)-dependent dehydrogenase (short-subunit alcohol dehydrogenase family)